MKSQDGILIGNQLDKSQLSNPIARRMVAGFDGALLSLIDALRLAPGSAHEVGCGEGRLSKILRDRLRLQTDLRATDFSHEIITENTARNEPGIQYLARSIYDLDPAEDRADLIVCCEVLEHLERPAEAIAALRRLGAPAYILSVPREPLWRGLNMARGKYLSALGNTPGHFNHWSSSGFSRFLAKGGFRVEHRRQPLPWTIVSGRFE